MIGEAECSRLQREGRELLEGLKRLKSGGSLFLFNRHVVRHFRKDGYNWRKDESGRKVVERHMELKVRGVKVLNCYYAYGEENENFRRRCYWMLEEEPLHIVLVHYLDEKNSHSHSARGLTSRFYQHENNLASLLPNSAPIPPQKLFSINELIPNWAYEGSEIQVFITGTFLVSQQEAQNCKWACMFGEVEVEAEITIDGFLCCQAPAQEVGRVPFYVTCNGLACSEKWEFEYIFTFPKRLEDLLRFENVSNYNPDRRENDDGEQMLKEKFQGWLRQNLAEGGEGLNLLYQGRHGAVHIVAALGLDWALVKLYSAGANINSRDVNGWTALHWAVFCDREETVRCLIHRLRADPSEVTNPTPMYRYSKTAAGMARDLGLKKIVGIFKNSPLLIGSQDNQEVAMEDEEQIELIESSHALLLSDFFGQRDGW